MTVSDDLNFGEQAGGDEGAPPYPVVFGIAFTPPIIGIVVASLGLLGAIYMLLNMVGPAWEAYQQQVEKRTSLENDITEKTRQSKQIEKVQEELAKSKQQQTQVLSLFANEKNLDTLLLDTNRLVESGNPSTAINSVRAQLKKFIPNGERPEIITDSSFGELVNNKLKRSSVNVEVVGTFEQTQSIIRNIERLQPLLIVKNFETRLDTTQLNQQRDSSGRPTRLLTGPLPIITSFQLQALMPLTAEESKAEAAKAAAQAKAKK
jgi:type IV pilus assembly protein PilO